MRTFILSLVMAAFCMSGAARALEARFEADGLDLVLKLSDDRTMRGLALAGMTLIMGSASEEAEIRIDAVAFEMRVRDVKTTLYRMSVKQRDTGRYQDLCEADSEGERAAIAYPDGNGGFSLTCTSGAEGKCILLGYFPWEKREGLPARGLHRACVHMMRADYGGDNKPAARNGTKINIIDRFGIQDPGSVSWMAFEAAWGPDGAVCVAHPRIADNVTLEQLAERYPHLKGRLGPHVCYEQIMRSDPRALIFNESVLTWYSKQ